jgi:hypothetical protein
MTKFQREKGVIDVIGVPVNSKGIMTFDTIGRKPNRGVIRILCSTILVHMAIGTFVSDAVKLQFIYREMTVDTTGYRMSTYEGKPILLVQFRDVIYQPIGGGVATGTFIPHRHAMHIRMAGKTIARCFIEYE